MRITGRVYAVSVTGLRQTRKSVNIMASKILKNAKPNHNDRTPCLNKTMLTDSDIERILQARLKAIESKQSI